jgi:lipid-A-disaccharide synthase
MKSQETCLIIAGEKSGEDHAMTFLPRLMKARPNCKFYGVGGDRLAKEGVELLHHTRDFSGIGISEVLSKIPFYYKALDEILVRAKKENTQTAILIDFQGFNLKLAKKLKASGVEVLYYVAPQAWVWKPWRAKVLEQNVHTLFTILPFEKKWFQDRGVSKVRGVIHPLMIEYQDQIASLTQKKHSDFSNRAVKILLLPGSRNVEVSKLLDVFLNGVSILKDEGLNIEIGVVKTETVKKYHYECAKNIKNVWEAKDLSQAMNWADMSVAASGTVTLATGIFGLPTVVCYKVSFFTEAVLGMLIPYDGPVSLTNIIHEDYLYPELIQHHADKYNIAKNLREWITNSQKYDSLTEKLLLTHKKLTGDDINVPEYMAKVIEDSYGAK